MPETLAEPILVASDACSTPDSYARDASVGSESKKAAAWSPTSTASTATGGLSTKRLIDFAESPAARREHSARAVDFGLVENGSVSGASSGSVPGLGLLAERLGLAECGGCVATGVSGTDAVVTVPTEQEGRVYWEGFFINMPMFSGYAALFGLQHEIKTKFGIQDSSSPLSIEFGVACSFLYIFNLIFRLSHNIVFCFVGPFGRTLIAMVAMMLSMLTIAVPIMSLGSLNMGWVYLAYGLGGVAIGTFEGNLLCCLTPLGHRTKHLAIIAIPVGITTVLVGGFFAMGPPFHIQATTIYLTVAIGVACGMVLFVSRIPYPKIAGEARQGLGLFLAEAKAWREWLPLIWHLPIATAVDMFTLSAFSPGVALYIWDTETVSIFGLDLPTKSFFAIFNSFNMLGGLLGRYLSYRVRPRHPLVYVPLNLLGAAVLLTKIPALAIVSTMVVMMGDGLIYGSIIRRIDTHVPKRFNLVAISFWLFVGDFGSVLGSNLISYIRLWVVGS